MDKAKKNKDITFYSLPKKKQDEIIKKAIRGANKDQMELEKEYERKYKPLRVSV